MAAWQARFDLGYVNGKRKALYEKTRRQVVEKLKKALAEQQGTLALDERQTVDQFLTHWLELVARPSIRPRTYASYAQVLRLYLLPRPGAPAARETLGATGPGVLERPVHSRAAGAYGPVPPCDLAPRPRPSGEVAVGPPQRRQARDAAHKLDRPEVQPLTVEQAGRLLKAVRDDRLEALSTVALSLGLRQSEALGLRWQDVDLDRGLLTVRYQLQRIDGRFALTEPKSACSRRTLELPPIAVEALRAHKVRQLEERLRMGPAWQGWDHDLVFTTTIGTPLDARNVVCHFHGLLAMAGLPRMPFHTLRHTAASLLLAAGVDLKVVQHVLGHSQIGMTGNVYTHVLPVLLKDAAEKIEAHFRR